MNITRFIQTFRKQVGMAIIGKAGGVDTGWHSLFTTHGYQQTKEFYQGLVYKCIDMIGSNVAKSDYGLYRGNGNQSIEVFNHPAFQLLQKPNKHQTGVDLLYSISSHIDAAGEAYMYLVRNLAGTRPVEIWLLDPFRVTPIKDSNAFIIGYKYRKSNGTEETFGLDEIVPIMRPNPFNQYEGMSAIEMARLEIEADLNAVDWNKNFFKRGAMPSGILTTEETVSDESFKRLKREFNESYSGKDNAYSTLVLDSGLTYQQVSLKQKDMDFIEQRKLSRDQLLAIMGVPKALLFADDVNRANAEAAKYFFAEHTLSPRLDLIFEKLNAFYLPKFQNTENLKLKFPSPVPENKEYELNKKDKAIGRWMTPNEVRAEDGLEPLDGGDTIEFTVVDPMTNAKTIYRLKAKVSTNDKKYLVTRRKYLAKKEKQMLRKYKAQLNYFVESVGTESKKIFKKDLGSMEVVLNKVFPNLTRWTKAMADITFDYGLENIEEAIAHTSEAYNLPSNFNIQNTGAIQYLSKRSVDTANDVVKTQLDTARTIIKEELEKETANIKDIVARIKAELKVDLDWRAERIARTELITAYNEGAKILYQSSDVVKSVKWITAKDESVCPVCSQNDGEIVNKTRGVFPSGHSNAPAHPNCRCDIVPYFE